MEKKEIFDLPLVEFFIEDENSGLFGDLNAVSVVTSPAIEKSYKLFSTSSIESDFKITSKDKMEITGPVMIPNKKILRYNEEKKEYYNCFFSEGTVKKCSEVYLSNNNHNKANFEHEKFYTSKVRMTQSWIVEDPTNDKANALGFEDVTPGTWFATFKVYDEKLWEELKNSDFSGFSVEGDFIYNSANFSDDAEKLSKIESITDDVNLSTEEKKQAIKLILDI